MFRAADQFEIRAKLQDEKDLERKKWFIAAKNREQQKDLKQERREDALEDIAAAVILATENELQEFSAQLDVYDEATVKAIVRNREILDQFLVEREAMLVNAYVLEDGTRVFKSEDGQRVYDEHGGLVSSNVITPEEIPDNFETAEPYLRVLEGIRQHQAIENDLYAYQEQLDEARERLASGEMTTEELDQYREELQRNMPIEVKRELQDYDAPNEILLKSDFSASAQSPTLTVSDMVIDPALVPGM